MNERIKQLAEQAGWDNHHAQFDTRIDKFANLIIQDCIDILAGYRGKVIWENEEVMHLPPIYVIQKHFSSDTK